MSGRGSNKFVDIEPWICLISWLVLRKIYIVKAMLFHQLSGHEFEQTLGDMKDREAWHAEVHGVSKSQTRFNDWTITNGLSNSHVQIWDLTHTEGWIPQNWCFQTVVLEKTLALFCFRRQRNFSKNRSDDVTFWLKAFHLCVWISTANRRKGA